MDTNSRPPELKIDWCSYEAAKFAVEHWHYSKTMPVAKQVDVGVWEGGEYIGAVIFSWGANPNLLKPFGLAMTEGCELVRVALQKHNTPVSRIVAIAIKMLRQQSPGLRLIVSYADTRMGHLGSIYQAGNWVYTGMTSPKTDFQLGSMILQRRSYTGRNFGGGRRRPPPGARKVESPPKHRYLYPLDKAMRRQIEPLRQPYPKREPAGEAKETARADTLGETGGASPTRPLLSEDET